MLNLKSWPMSMPGSKRRMIEKLWPNIPRPNLEVEQREACLATGVGGVHSGQFFDPDGGACEWCGVKSQPGRFVVPFFGSGVDSAHFVNQGFRVVASDAQPLLVRMHHEFAEVVKRARTWTNCAAVESVEDQRAFYLQLREEHNEDPEPWSLYTLNKHAHSQLVRHNRKGDFNAPFGELRPMPTPDVVAAHVEFIAEIDGPHVMDFAEAMQAAQPGDAVYLDPPYYGTFDGYTGQRFETQRLLFEIVKLRDRDIPGAMSNSPAVLDLLPSYGLVEGVKIHHYTRAGTITVAAKERQPVGEVLVVWGGRL